ncbi:hypothetical protein EE612_008836, partial [Oryza sativa]
LSPPPAGPHHLAGAP